jgi:putative PIN family toxin of toxin-antitoxin system
MRIIVDTNVHISVALFPTDKMVAILDDIQKNYKLVLFDYIIDEIINTTTRKFPHKMAIINDYLNKLVYEKVDNSGFTKTNYPTIKDFNDLPILANAIESQVDILVTGDSDFHEVVVDKPRIMAPRQYFDEYVIQ